MSFLTKRLNQTATHWSQLSIDNFGDSLYNTPTTTLVRWEDRSELFTNADGREEVARSVIYLSVDVAKGDFLYLGTSTAADPTTVVGAHIVKDFRKIPDLSGGKYERRAML